VVVVVGGGGADITMSPTGAPAPALSLAKIAGSREHESEGTKERRSEGANAPKNPTFRSLLRVPRRNKFVPRFHIPRKNVPRRRFLPFDRCCSSRSLARSFLLSMLAVFVSVFVAGA